MIIVPKHVLIQLISIAVRANLGPTTRCPLTKEHPKMTRKTDNAEALDAFLAAKAEIDAMLTRLQALSADHFETHPDGINWGHVGNHGW